MHPSMRDAPNMERDNLQFEQHELKRKIDGVSPTTKAAEASAAANETMTAFSDGLDAPIAAAEAKVDAFVNRMVERMKFSVQPVISPKLDMSSISGVHADVGIR